MFNKSIPVTFGTLAMLSLAAMPAAADPFFFSTGNPDGKMATASRPESPGLFEIESADDFALTSPTSLSNATFTGLIPLGSNVQSIVVEIYRVFPNDSDVGRTSGPPTFSTPQVPTRVNSPSDAAFDSRDSLGGTLNFSTSVLAASFAADNSVKPGGIHPMPGQKTGGNGPVAGEEVEFLVNFTSALLLPADHYFFVPQVRLDTGDFFWLSAPRPIVLSAFPPGITDLQSWTRDQFLDPDWLRIGTDIVGGDPVSTFNAAFSITGTTVPEPASLMFFSTALVAFGLWRRRERKRPPTTRLVQR
jgi:hypothetical protein